MKIIELVKEIEKMYPLNKACDFDNVGMQVGDKNNVLKGVLMCLDVTFEVIEEAIKNDINLIIAHHPLIYKPLKNIISDNIHYKKIQKLIQNNINLYVMHTNYDYSKNGMNDVLANILNLENTLSITNDGLGRFSSVNEVPIKEYINFVKKVFNLDYALFIGEESSIVKKVGIIGGNGSDYLNECENIGIDLLITGDIKFHYAMEIKEMKLNVLDVGHNIEYYFIYDLKKILNNKFKDLKVITIKNNNPYKIV